MQLGDSHGARCEEFGPLRAQRRTSAGASDPTVGFVALRRMSTGFVPDLMSTALTDRKNGTRTEAHMIFGTFVLLSAIVFWRMLGALVSYSLHNESGSHIILIPLVSAYLLFKERQRIFSSVRPSIAIGICVILTGVVLFLAATRRVGSWQGDESLSVATLSIVLICVGGFLSSYGLGAARAAAFPLLFLILMVPLPDRTLGWAVHLLQQGSTEVAYFLFNVVGVPVLRQGFVLSVPSVTIQVAAECSGIRSSIALFITCLLATHLYLRTPWKIAVFLLLVFPVAVIKNGVRIVTLTLLSIYVDPSFLHGKLHRDGGFVFFLLALLLLFPVFVVLERSESLGARADVPQSLDLIANR
jgi:exosortase